MYAMRGTNWRNSSARDMPARALSWRRTTQWRSTAQNWRAGWFKQRVDPRSRLGTRDGSNNQADDGADVVSMFLHTYHKCLEIRVLCRMRVVLRYLEVWTLLVVLRHCPRKRRPRFSAVCHSSTINGLKTDSARQMRV